MADAHRVALTSGNIVTVDESGVQVTSPTGQELRSFDFAAVARVRRDDATVHVDERAGGSWALPTPNPEAAIELETALRHQLVAEVSVSEVKVDPTDGNTVDYDNANQMQRIQGGLVPGETLFAVYDMKGGGTGFIGITDRRIITQDENSFGQKRKSLVSIPYSHISMLASRDEGGFMRKTSALTIITSSGLKFEFEFRSGDKAECAYIYIIQHLK